jgi:recombination associated protein RdgC
MSMAWGVRLRSRVFLSGRDVFKNLTVYRMASDWAATTAAIEAELDKARFAPCGASQEKSMGWVEPRGIAFAPLVESIGGHLMLKVMTEQKVVPGSVVKRRVDELAEQIEKQTGRKPGKKQQKELKDQAMLELLPMAFTKQSATRVWIAPAERMVVLDCASQGKADEVITMLIQAVEGLALSLVQTEMSPSVSMAHWLGTGEPPYAFLVDNECELKSTDEMKSVVRYTRHNLDTDEVKQHIVSGKMPTKLALTWRERVSFILTESMALKKVAFQDVVFEGSTASAAKTDKNEAFDADVAIFTGEFVELIPELLEALGGEQVIGQGPVDADGVPRPERAMRVADQVVTPSPGAASGAGATDSVEPPPWA